MSARIDESSIKALRRLLTFARRSKNKRCCSNCAWWRGIFTARFTSKGRTEKGRISNWRDRSGEHDFKIVYRSSRDQHIGIADGLSQIPTRLTYIGKAEDKDRMATQGPTFCPKPALYQWMSIKLLSWHTNEWTPKGF